MSDFYKDMQGIASSLLKEFNQGVIEYVAITPGAGPADAPGAPVERAFQMDAVARGVQQRYVDGTNIVQSDLQIVSSVDVRSREVPFDDGSLWDNLAMWAAETTTPDMRGFVRIDGERFKVIGVKKIPPAGLTIAYVIIFRK